MTPLPPGHFQLLAAYNSWANERLFSAALRLPDSEITRSRPAAFFDSLLGTVNHIFVGDSLWLARLAGRPTPPGYSLDHSPFNRLEDLWQARQTLDQEISDLVAGMDTERLQQVQSYKTSMGEAQSTRVDLVLTHLFNHQTHHRGQAHALLSETEQAPPPLDLIYYLRDLGQTGG
ncbi:DinB family protein [Rhodovibrionaceae bacterium A322]